MRMLLARCASKVGVAGGILPCRRLAAPFANHSLRLASSTPKTPFRHLIGADPADFPPIKKPQSPILEVKGTSKKGNFTPNLEIPMGPDYEDLRLNLGWLRDNCTCSKCIDPHSGQKTFSTSDLNRSMVVEHIERTEDSGLRIVWAPGCFKGRLFGRPKNHEAGETQESVTEEKVKEVEEVEVAEEESKGADMDPRSAPHESIYSFEYLASLSQPPPFHRYRQWPQEWFSSSFVPKNIDYAEWMAGGDLFEESLLALDKTGLIFVKGVPKDEKSVEEVASKIGNIYETLYGRTWDVRSKEKAENLAYTEEYLAPHQDLMYKSEPPRIQLLHCLENSCEGGESTYSDGRSAARLLIGSEYLALSQWPVRYGYDRNGHLYHYERPVFSGELENHPIDELNMNRQPLPGADRDDVNNTRRWMLAWSPPFQTLQMPAVPSKYHIHNKNRMYNTYRQAAHSFGDHIKKPHIMLQYMMQPGDCVLFDNWRILHGRRKFDAKSGDRWLKGTYIDHQAFDSKVRSTLRERERQGKWEMEPMPDYPALSAAVYRGPTHPSHKPAQTPNQSQPGKAGDEDASVEQKVESPEQPEKGEEESPEKPEKGEEEIPGQTTKVE